MITYDPLQALDRRRDIADIDNQCVFAIGKKVCDLTSPAADNRDRLGHRFQGNHRAFLDLRDAEQRINAVYDVVNSSTRLAALFL